MTTTLIKISANFNCYGFIYPFIVAHSEGEELPGKLRPLQLNSPGDEMEEHQGLQYGDGWGGDDDYRQVEVAVSPGVKPTGDETARDPGPES